MKVLFITNVPSPYRVDFFNELGKLCDLTVVFEKRTSDERNISWKNYIFDSFKGVFLKGKSVAADRAVSLGIIKYVIDKQYDRIICGDMSSPTGIIAIYTMKLFHIPYYLEADGGTAKSGKGLKEWIKKTIISGAYGYFSTSKSCDRYFITYGAKSERIYRYPFTSLKNNDILQIPVAAEKKKALRTELGLTEDKIIISVGRFSYMNGYGKGYDTLLKVCEKLTNDYGVYIIGDEPTEEFVRWKEREKLDHLHFLPFKPKKELFKYYQAADLSVLLTRGEAWGLVINESMANGCPVLTTDACVAGLELIEDQINGYIVPVGNETLTYERIVEYFSNEHYQKFSERSLQNIIGYTIEKMAHVHLEVFQ